MDARTLTRWVLRESPGSSEQLILTECTTGCKKKRRGTLQKMEAEREKAIEPSKPQAGPQRRTSARSSESEKE